MTFIHIRRGSPVLVKIGRKCRALYMRPNCFHFVSNELCSAAVNGTYCCVSMASLSRCIVDSGMCKGRHCCVCRVMMATRTRHDITLHLTWYMFRAVGSMQIRFIPTYCPAHFVPFTGYFSMFRLTYLAIFRWCIHTEFMCSYNCRR